MLRTIMTSIGGRPFILISVSPMVGRISPPTVNSCKERFTNLLLFTFLVMFKNISSRRRVLDAPVSTKALILKFEIPKYTANRVPEPSVAASFPAFLLL